MAATVLVACAVIVAGCGKAAPGVTQRAASLHTSASSSTAVAAPLLVVNTYNGTATTISLVDMSGHTVASTTLAHQTISWATGGPRGAYWTAAGHLHVLDRNGTVSDAGPLPATWFRVGPDGSLAYAVNTPAGGPHSSANRAQLFLLRNGTAHLLAERIADPDHPTADAPQNAWGYEAMAWNSAGLVIARVPLGGCGCGPFGMQTTYGFTGVVDVDSGVAAPVTNDRACPLSGIAADGTGVCFHTPVVPTSKDEGRGVDELRIIHGGHVAQRFSMSTLNAAGDAVFSPDATRIAYATVAAGSDCGTWEAQTALHVLDLQQGTAQVIGASGMQPLAWLDGGHILAEQSLAAPNAMTSTRVVVIDVATGASTTLTTATAQQVQIAVQT